jgi:hypothetical protein
VEGQILHANGTKVGGEFTVATNVDPSFIGEFTPSVASLGLNHFVVTWENVAGAVDNIHAQIFSAVKPLPTHFTASEAVNMNNLPGLHSLLTKHLKFTHETKASATGHIGDFTYIFKSLHSDHFTYRHKQLTGGTIGSVTVESHGNVVYKFTGLIEPVLDFTHLTGSHSSLAALTSTLLAGNDIITGSSQHNDVLAGGVDYNTYVFKKHFGHDTIFNFVPTDIIEISRKIFHNFTQLHKHLHLVHGDVQIKVDAADTITLDTVHHVSDLVASEFLFI